MYPMQAWRKLMNLLKRVSELEKRVAELEKKHAGVQGDIEKWILETLGETSYEANELSGRASEEGFGVVNFKRARSKLSREGKIFCQHLNGAWVWALV